MLIENEVLYTALEYALRVFYNVNGYVFVHAIYEPDEGMYHAAADLYEPGETYHVYFVINDDDSIAIDHTERWMMG